MPTKKTKFLHSHVVDYFAGNKAVDLLMQVKDESFILSAVFSVKLSTNKSASEN